MKIDYETLQRQIYDASLEIAKRMGDPCKTLDIFTIQRRLLANRLTDVERTEKNYLPPDFDEYSQVAKRLVNEYGDKFEELRTKQKNNLNKK